MSAAMQFPAVHELRSRPVRLSAFVLTKNEERNLETCLESLAGWCSDVHLVDSFSTDNTVKIAERYGVHIHQHAFEGHTKQRTWALRHVPFRNDWVLALDADHRVGPELQQELSALFAESPRDVDGFYVSRKQIFRGRWIRHGGYYPHYMMKVFRHSVAFLDDDEFDYRFYVPGATRTLRHDILEENVNERSISWFIEKHNRFATEQAVEQIKRTTGGRKYLVKPTLFGNHDQRKLWLKSAWYRLPLYTRPFLLFFYRYFFRFGFLDGKEGFVFHFLQSLWFRLLVDIRLEELRAVQSGSDPCP